MKLFFAAPLSGLPFDPTALGAHASRLHLARKAVRAAPASSRPFFPIALLSHVPGVCAAAEPRANAVNKTASISRVIFTLQPCLLSILGEARAREALFWPFLILNAFSLAQFRAGQPQGRSQSQRPPLATNESLAPGLSTT